MEEENDLPDALVAEGGGPYGAANKALFKEDKYAPIVNWSTTWDAVIRLDDMGARAENGHVFSTIPTVALRRLLDWCNEYLDSAVEAASVTRQRLAVMLSSMPWEHMRTVAVIQTEYVDSWFNNESAWWQRPDWMFHMDVISLRCLGSTGFVVEKLASGLNQCVNAGLAASLSVVHPRHGVLRSLSASCVPFCNWPHVLAKAQADFKAGSNGLLSTEHGAAALFAPFEDITGIDLASFNYIADRCTKTRFQPPPNREVSGAGDSHLRRHSENVIAMARRLDLRVAVIKALRNHELIGPFLGNDCVATGGLLFRALCTAAYEPAITSTKDKPDVQEAAARDVDVVCTRTMMYRFVAAAVQRGWSATAPAFTVDDSEDAIVYGSGKRLQFKKDGHRTVDLFCPTTNRDIAQTVLDFDYGMVQIIFDGTTVRVSPKFMFWLCTGAEVVEPRMVTDVQKVVRQMRKRAAKYESFAAIYMPCIAEMETVRSGHGHVLGRVLVTQDRTRRLAELGKDSFGVVGALLYERNLFDVVAAIGDIKVVGKSSIWHETTETIRVALLANNAKHAEENAEDEGGSSGRGARSGYEWKRVDWNTHSTVGKKRTYWEMDDATV